MSLKLFSLNCRGLNKRLKRKYILNQCNKYHISCLQETYITNEVAANWKNEWNGELYFHSGTSNSKGQIILLNKNIDMDKEPSVIQCNERLIALDISVDGIRYFIINIYAPNKKQEKVIFYNYLNTFLNSLDSDIKTIICGDFNTVLDNKLDIISGLPHDKKEIENFNSLLSKFDLYDSWRTLNPQNKDFTWHKSSPLIARRLDYVLCNQYLVTKILKATHVNISCSDHKGVLVEFNNLDFKRGPSIWHFNNSLLKDMEYIKFMNSLIDTYLESNKNNSNYQRKWELLKAEIKSSTIQFCTNKNRKMNFRENNTKKELDRITQLLVNNPDSQNLKNIFNKLKLEKELHDLNKTKGAQVRSKIKFIEEGEKNTKYFLGVEKVKGVNKTIQELNSENGAIKEPTQIINKIKSYYSKLFSSDESVDDSLSSLNSFLDNTEYPVLKTVDKEFCEKNIDISELSSALSNLNGNSVAGIDGLTVSFFKMFWNRLNQPLFNCFEEALEKGELTVSQKRGIITLLHKGKDRKELNNWRPITLLNTDYKIFSKVIASRLQHVISDIISKSQKGFIKGRNINELIRYIDDSINLAKSSNTPGIIASVDFSKAFDSVSKKAIINVLETFNFGPKFMKLVSVLLNNSESCVRNAGWFSSWFPCEKGVRQGCCASPYLFLIVAEVMSIKLRSSTQLEGIKFENLNINLTKVLQYADDTTLILKDEDELETALEVVDKFGKLCGLKLNRNKSSVLPIGGFKRNFHSRSEVKWVKEDEFIKITGIYFNSSNEASKIELNWKSQVENIITTIHSWSRRNLSLYGKVIVCKTHILSKINFLIQSLALPSYVLEKIDGLMFKFIWQKRCSEKKAFEKIKRSVLCKDIAEGGMNMISIQDQQKVSLIKWMKKIIEEKEEKSIPKHHMSKIGGIPYILKCKIENPDNIINQNISSHFWKEVATNWLKLNQKIIIENEAIENILTQPIFLNSEVKYKGNVLFMKNMIKNKIKYVYDLFLDNQIKCINDIRQGLGQQLLYPGLTFDYNAIINAIPKNWKRILEMELTHDNLQLAIRNNVDIPIRIPDILNKKNQEIRKIINDTKNATICSKNFWKRKYDIDISNHFNIAKQTTQETRLKVLHFKILHNIYPTKILLHKMKIKENNLCDTCQKTEYLEHFFVECALVKEFWKSMKSLILRDINKNISLTPQRIIFGINVNEINNREYTARDIKYINFAILVGKMSISKAKYGTVKNIAMVFEHEWDLRSETVNLLKNSWN